jgi:cysteinyl-tRNA synthetase
MAMKIFGPTLDIHTGAIDLIFPHHTNEIAQSESSTGKTFVNYWVHGAFMNVSDEKMAKSKGNFLKLSDLVEAKISPLSYRYWLMTAHYRSQVNFTFEAVLSAQKALIHLIETAGQLPGGGKIDQGYQYTFHEVINNDFNLPEAVALVWKLLKDKTVNDADKKATILDFDRVLGLKLDAVPVVTSGHIPDEIIALSEARDLARAEKDWVKSDALRKEIQARGYDVRDSGGKTEIFEI